MNRMRVAGFAVPLTALAALGLTGCGGSGDSAPSFTTQSPESSAAATPSASSQAPSTPGPTTGDTLKTADVESLIKDKLISQEPSLEISVTCPEDIPVQAGGTFDCTATVNGQKLDYVVTQEDTEGNINAEPRQAVLLLKLLQDKISESVTQSSPGTWSTSCDPSGSAGGIYIAAVGSTFTCEVTGTKSDGSAGSGTITVTVEDTDGNVNFTSD